jgi:DNA-binding PadR family transcriptional regulator
MSLEYAILGFLEVGPKTGYDLKQRFDRSVSGFWHADQSRIYRTLEALRERGWVVQRVVPQADRPDRKPYSLTAAGREAFYRWMEAPQSGPPSRNAFLVQLFFAGLLSDENAIRLLEAKRERILGTLAAFPERYRLAPKYEHDEPQRVDFFHWLTLDSAVCMRYAYLSWIDGAIDRIRGGKYKKGREAAVTHWPPYEDPRRLAQPKANDGTEGGQT